MSDKRWLCLLGVLLVFWIVSAAVRDYGVQSEYDALNDKYQEAVAENSDLQIKVYKLETEIVKLKAQIPK